MSHTDRQKWNDRYSRDEPRNGSPTPFLLRQKERLPQPGKALDLAGGTGRNALWLAEHGWDTTLADISAIGLQIASRQAARRGLRLQTVEVDLGEQPPPQGPWDVIVVVCYLQRSLMDRFAQLLAPGGCLIYSQPTRRNLERHQKPPADFLLGDGELPQLCRGLEIVAYEEGWIDDDRHEAHILARRPADER